MRIGQGIRSIEDPALMTYLQGNNIHLEICPTCNVQTDVVAIYPEHPVNQIYQYGVPISINTDTRGITNITLTEEYEKLSNVFGWEPGDFLTCNLNALKAAFLPSDIKNDLVKKLHSCYKSAGLKELNA